MTGRGGRPRDPHVTARILTAATELLARDRALTAATVADRAGVGKASICGRWRTLGDLLTDVVTDLGVHGPVPDHGDTRDDLLWLLTAVSTGTRAVAEAAVLPQIGGRLELRRAYADGPLARLEQLTEAIHDRALARGEARWPSNAPVAGGVALLQLQIQATGLPPDDEDVEQVLDQVVLPGLGIAAAVWP